MRSVWRTLAWLGWVLIGWPISSLMRSIRRTLRDIGYSLRWIGVPIPHSLRWISGIFRSIGRIFYFPFWIVRAWWSERQIKYLLFGLPALAVLGGVGVFILATGGRNSSDLGEAYFTAARSAYEAKSYPAARLYFERGLQLLPGRSEMMFELAKAAEQVGDDFRVTAILDQLSPLDHPVYMPAHLFKATQILSKPYRTAEETAEAEAHLLHALTLEENNVAGHQLLGELYFSFAIWDKAINHLLVIAPSFPEKALTLAKAYVLHGEEEKGRSWGQRARKYYSSESVKRPQDLKLLTEYADSCMFLGDYKESAAILKDGLKRFDAPILKSSLCRVYGAWASELMQPGPNQDLNAAFDLLADALLLNPEDILVFDRMMVLMRADESTAEKVREYLQQNIAAGRALVMSHFILGTFAFVSDNSSSAKFHLERAYELSPSAPILANNLAWLLIQGDKPEADRALDLIETAIQHLPDDTRLLDTRGHVFVKLGRWRDAIRDLEQSLNTHRNKPGTHLALAEAYQGEGISDLAEQHRKYAAELERASQPKLRGQ